MSDLISREEVLRAIITAGVVEPDLGYAHLYKVIENLPSAKASQNLAEHNKELKGSDLIRREDAIDAICKEWCCVPYDNCPHRDDGFACDGCDDVKAIRTLTPTKSTNTPTNTPTDLISRADAIEALGEEPEVWTDTEEEWAYRNAWVEHISAIKSLPSAEPKTGKWILDQNGMDWNIPAWRCSECGFVANYIGVEAKGFGNNPMNWSGSKFCPQCGARITGYER